MPAGKLSGEKLYTISMAGFYLFISVGYKKTSIAEVKAHNSKGDFKSNENGLFHSSSGSFSRILQDSTQIPIYQINRYNPDPEFVQILLNDQIKGE